MTHVPLQRLWARVPKIELRPLLSAIRRALERSRQRRALAQLSDARLRDVGLTRADVAQETMKPFWRP